MTNINFFFTDTNQSKINKKTQSSNIKKKFDRVFTEVKSNVSDTSKTLNVLNKKFKFNFKIKDLKKFKKFKTIALIGMGGSILGAEAVHNFLHLKIKKKNLFF